jgi:hypothetical protein
MRNLRNIADDGHAERFTAELESALLAQALAETGGLPDERAKALLSVWLRGMFNATAASLRSIGDGRGVLAWESDGEGYRLTWYAPTGFACPLARIYRQGDDTWAAQIVAGVREDAAEAMIAAEWGVVRLAA